MNPTASSLRQHIAGEIRKRGPIPFSRYMELCLHGAPEEGMPGYYSQVREQFGKSGDFYTSSDVHALFGRLLARQFEQMWNALERPTQLDLVELGPGRGLFAQDVLDWCDKVLPELAGAIRYTLVEISPTLRERLEKRFAHRIDTGKVRIVSGLGDVSSSGLFVVFANEFFDALPVEVVSDRGELRIAVDQDGGFFETFAPAPEGVLEFMDRYSIRPESDERIEVPLRAMEVMRKLGAAVGSAGFMVFIDYGYTREEQLAGRHRGTLRGFSGHSLREDLYRAPGEHDITADVNFTALRAAARDVGFESLALLTQAEFLMGIGERDQFAEAFSECRLPQERAKVALQLKHLVTPAGMGESFHVLLLSKGVTKGKAAQLSGLRFARL